MNIAITFRHMESSDPVKVYAHEKVGKLQRFLREPMRARIILDLEHRTHGCEVEVSAGASRFVASERGEDMYACIDKVTDKMERQITGKHSSQVTRKKRVDSAGASAAAQLATDDGNSDEAATF